MKKDRIFLDQQDYKNFLYRAKVLLGLLPPPKRTKKGGIKLTVLPSNAIEVLSYCLMPNHFHFLIKQREVDSVKKFFHRLSTSYATYFNKKYDKVGHIFQGIYKAKNILNDSYLTHVSAYIHLNPAKPFEWEYSSLPEYMGQRSDSFVSTQMLTDMNRFKPESYKNFLLSQFKPSILEEADLLFDDD